MSYLPRNSPRRSPRAKQRHHELAQLSTPRASATAARAALVLPCLSQIGLAWAHLAEAHYESRLAAGQLLTLGTVQRTDDLFRTAGWLNGGAFAVAGVLFLVWFSRCYTNLLALGESRLRYSAELVVRVWFIPIMNVVVPLQILNSIRDLAGPQRSDAAKPGPRRSHVLPNIWWYLFVVSAIPTQYVLFKFFLTVNPTVHHRAEAALNLVGVVAAVMAMQLVRSITRGVQERADEVAAAIAANRSNPRRALLPPPPPPPPPPPVFAPG